ncbi:transposable element Tcb2 transposase [Trichonephila clavipes]|nr:transposable element Tcb2 transposase [Trichonephila clavipes]
MDCPAYSPDLNPIEHVWDALGRRIAARLHHPENTQQLKQMLIEEWALLPQEMLHQLVLIIRRRCEATIAEWHRRFKDGRESIEGNEHDGLPSTSRNEKNVALVSECVRKNRRKTHKSLRLNTSRRRLLTESIRRKRPQF